MIDDGVVRVRVDPLDESGVEPDGPVLDRLLGAPLGIEKGLIGAGIDFPVGQSLVLLGTKR